MRKKVLYGILVGLAAALVALGLWEWGKLNGIENLAWRWRVRWLAQPSAETPRIKVILLDQASLDWGKKEMGLAWPWPREIYSALLDFCARGGARSVAFDVVFTEPSFYGVADDETFGAAIGRTRAFVAALYIGGETAGDAAAWPEGVLEPWPVFDGLSDWLRTRTARAHREVRAAFPVPELVQPGLAWGNVSDQPDFDGVFRRAALFRVFDGRAVPSLGLAAWLADQKAAGSNVTIRLEPEWLHVGDRRIPIDRRGRATLRFLGRSGTHPSFSAASVIQSELRLREGGEPVVDPETLRDSYVFFGFSAPGLLDLRPTPISRVFPGVEIHTTMLDNLLSISYLRDARSGAVVLVTLLLAFLSGVAVTLGRKAWQNVVAFAVFLPIPLVAGFVGYRAGVWWPVAVGETAVLLALVGAVVVNYATEGRQKAFIKSAFKFYLGETIIDQLLADPSRLTLGGEKRELTIFFSDIEKFSSFSERLDPTRLIGLLNEYLSEMGEIIKEEGGYLDKFIGDAIVAFWNAPVA
ncbi:MAG: adenylate/guanylate cyclase domain-containing protein, partial [Verrucomicrobia bacterium]|nr:adenylate/guanylate cyclase domain-containing protein [Verrucomicrobiota bacterium]